MAFALAILANSPEVKTWSKCVFCLTTDRTCLNIGATIKIASDKKLRTLAFYSHYLPDPTPGVPPFHQMGLLLSM